MHVAFKKDFYWKRYFWDRIGFLPRQIKSLIKNKECIWLQAISEGDVISLSRFLQSIKKILPSYKIIFSTKNHASFRMLQEMKGVDAVIYFPWDIGFFCRRVLNTIQPKLFIVVQHDYCLEFVKEAKKMGVKNILISGSIRPGEVFDYDGFQYKRAFSGNLFNYFDYLGVQSEKDRKNIIAFGADPKKLSISGSLKMDLSYAKLDIELTKKIYKSLCIDENTPIFLAGSTHKGDEDIIIDAFTGILTEIPNMKLIIVPRYIERSSEIKSIAESKYHNAKVVEDFNKKNESCDVLIIKMLGVLPRLYGIATVVFLGGSLVVGGHNILEPMYHGKPIFFGPYIHPQEEYCKRLKKVWNGIQFNDGLQLAKSTLALIKSPETIRRLSGEAKTIISENEKSLKLSIDYLINILITESIINN